VPVIEAVPEGLLRRKVVAEADPANPAKGRPVVAPAIAAVTALSARTYSEENSGQVVVAVAVVEVAVTGEAPVPEETAVRERESTRDSSATTHTEDRVELEESMREHAPVAQYLRGEPPTRAISKWALGVVARVAAETAEILPNTVVRPETPENMAATVEV